MTELMEWWLSKTNLSDGYKVVRCIKYQYHSVEGILSLTSSFLVQWTKETDSKLARRWRILKAAEIEITSNIFHFVLRVSKAK